MANVALPLGLLFFSFFGIPTRNVAHTSIFAAIHAPTHSKYKLSKHSFEPLITQLERTNDLWFKSCTKK